MKYALYLTILCFGLYSCHKTCPEKNYSQSPIYSFSNDSIIADHMSQTIIKVSIPGDATFDRRSLLVSVDSGTIVGATNNQITLNCVQDPTNTCYLFAQFTLISPTIPCTIHITLQDSDVAFFDSVKAYPSVPYQIVLNPSAYTVADSLKGNVTVSGRVYNQSGNNVSNGYNVVFQALWQTGSTSTVTGFFSNVQDTTNVNESISATFTPGNLPNDTTFYIVATVYQHGQALVPPVTYSVPIVIQ